MSLLKCMNNIAWRAIAKYQEHSIGSDTKKVNAIVFFRCPSHGEALWNVISTYDSRQA